MDKLLIIGTGLLGSRIVEMASEEFEIVNTYNKNPADLQSTVPYQLDITNQKMTFKLINKLNPDYIIHTAAHTGVDYCEVHRSEAYSVNVTGTRNVSEASDKVGAKLVYVSTDYVFDGAKGRYREGDMTNPINYYGKTKLEGEQVVKTICEDWIIARTSVLYGWNPAKPNFATWAIDELIAGNRIRIVNDQFNSPTLADNLADMLIELIKRDEHGVFHTSGSERISRYGFVIKIAEIFDLDSGLIEPITSDQLNWIAKRPTDSSLDVTKISNIEKALTIEGSLEKMRELQ
jgi:dTDP-4-dehydrorhamnose reductase